MYIELQLFIYMYILYQISEYTCIQCIHNVMNFSGKVKQYLKTYYAPCLKGLPGLSSKRNFSVITSCLQKKKYNILSLGGDTVTSDLDCKLN